MKPFSFIHAADLHLGSPFKGVGSKLPAATETLGAATYDAYSELIDLCLQKKVDFLLVAGDIFDSADRSLRAQLTFRDGLGRLSKAGISSFVVFGNHDPWKAWSNRITWPENVHLFSPDQVETVPVDIDGMPVAAVSGISYQTQHQTEDLSSKFIAAKQELYQIALLHGSCGDQPGHGVYAPCSLDALRKSGFDYWALGHVHENKILETRPHIVYPGCIQGLSIREAGAHGCWQVSVDSSHQTSLLFQPLDKVRWQASDIHITDLESLDDLDQAISSAISNSAEAGEGRPMILRIRITGRGGLYGQVRQPATIEELLERSRELGALETPSVWVQDMVVDCRPEVDMDRRLQMDDLLGQILKNVKDLGIEPDTLSEHLMPILSDLYQHTRLSRHLGAPSPLELQALLQEAALICYDQLEPDP